MTWNHRIFREPDGLLVIREVYYDEAGIITSCTEDAVSPTGDNIMDLMADMGMFIQAVGKPILKMANIPWVRETKGKRS